MVIKILRPVSRRSIVDQLRLIPGATIRVIRPRLYLVYDPSASARSRQHILFRVCKEQRDGRRE